MNRLALLFIISFASISVNAQSTLPTWFVNSCRQLKLFRQYKPVDFLNHAFIQADFNGDGKIDVAALTIEKKTGKKGIIIIHAGNNQYFILGAGSSFGNGSDDFKWARGWKIHKEKFAYKTTFDKSGDILGSRKFKLIRPAIFIYDEEDGEPNSGGIIYWNGKKYIWIHQGE